MRDAILVLEDGRTFAGDAYGARGETFGEAVFATGMTGYQETLTDPSYHRQVVVQTAPHIGNTGVNDEDAESTPHLGGRLRGARSGAPAVVAGARARSLDEELRAQGIVGISGIDTRALTRHLRERGAMRCGVSSIDREPATKSWPGARVARRCVGADLSAEVTTPQPYSRRRPSASTGSPSPRSTTGSRR